MKLPRGRTLTGITPVVLTIVLAVAVRSAVNFKNGMLPKMNAGYYLLQARSLVETRHLFRRDTPLVFHAGALASRFAGASVDGPRERNDSAVALGVGLFDSFIPLFLGLAAFWLARAMGAGPVGRAVAVGYACLSYPTLVMFSDFQKNALGLAFFLGGMAGAAMAVVQRRRWGWGVTGLFLGLCGVTHMPTFGAALLTFVTIAVVARLMTRRPSGTIYAGMALGLSAVLAIALVPKLRIYINPEGLATKVFSHPFILAGQVGMDEPAKPPDVVHLLVVWSVALYALRQALGGVSFPVSVSFSVSELAHYSLLA